MRLRFLLPPLLLLASPLSAQRMKLLVPLDSLVRRAARDSNDPAAHYEVALGYWLARQFDPAEAHLRQAVAIEPGMAPAYLALSYLPYARRPKLWDEEEKGKVPAELAPVLEEAWRFRRQAFLIDPLVDLKPLALMIPPASVLGLGGRDKAVYTYIMNGFGSFWDGQYGQAYQFFQDVAGKATDEDRRKYATWFLWYEALTAVHINDFPRAVTNLRILLARAEQRDQTDGGATLAFSTANHYRYALACVLDLSGNAQEAISLLQEAATTDAGLYMAHVRLAAIHADQRRPQASLEERRRAVAANPEDSSLLFALGEALARAGRLPDAQGVLRQARQANPRNVRALYVLGWVAQQLDSRDEARDAYQQFLALAPSRFDTQKEEARKRLASLQQ